MKKKIKTIEEQILKELKRQNQLLEEKNKLIKDRNQIEKDKDQRFGAGWYY